MVNKIRDTVYYFNTVRKLIKVSLTSTMLVDLNWQVQIARGMFSYSGESQDGG